jgi:hypothetical protein
MTTVILQMLTFLVSAFAFAAYVLRRDRCESQVENEADTRQQSIQFPENNSDRGERLGAAMSHL